MSESYTHSRTPRRCGHCGADLTDYRSHARFCGASCRAAAWRECRGNMNGSGPAASSVGGAGSSPEKKPFREPRTKPWRIPDDGDELFEALLAAFPGSVEIPTGVEA